MKLNEFISAAILPLTIRVIKREEHEFNTYLDVVVEWPMANNESRQVLLNKIIKDYLKKEVIHYEYNQDCLGIPILDIHIRP